MSHKAVALACLMLMSLSLPARAGDLDSQAAMPLVAGKGWGDIRLGMTLGDFASRFGTGDNAQYANDEQAIDLSFEGGQVVLQFTLNVDCYNELPVARNMNAALMRIKGCRLMPLQTIAISARPQQENTFYQGQSNHGIALFDSADGLIKRENMRAAPDAMMPSLAADQSAYAVESDEGIRYFYTSEKVGDALRSSVRQIVVFSPERN